MSPQWRMGFHLSEPAREPSNLLFSILIFTDPSKMEKVTSLLIERKGKYQINPLNLKSRILSLALKKTTEKH